MSLWFNPLYCLKQAFTLASPLAAMFTGTWAAPLNGFPDNTPPRVGSLSSRFDNPYFPNNLPRLLKRDLHYNNRNNRLPRHNKIEKQNNHSTKQVAIDISQARIQNQYQTRVNDDDGSLVDSEQILSP